MTDCSFRPAHVGDVPAIVEMMAEFFAYLSSLDGSESTFDPTVGLERVARDGFGEKPLFHAVIVEYQEKPVGYSIYNIAYWADALEGTVFVSDLFVREPWRGKGIGQELMRHLAEVGREAGCRRIMWTVWTENPAAQGFYKRMGATTMDEEILMSLAI
jgi:GNAT superfamily N-acetyltransferase